jgi:hypothetical protein
MLERPSNLVNVVAHHDFLREKAREIEDRLAELSDLLERLEPEELDDSSSAAVADLTAEAYRLSAALLALLPLWNEPHRTRRLRSQVESLTANYARLMPRGAPKISFPRPETLDEVEAAQKARPALPEEDDVDEGASGMADGLFFCATHPAISQLSVGWRGASRPTAYEPGSTSPSCSRGTIGIMKFVLPFDAPRWWSCACHRPL